jgi:hypothetical protein
MPPSEAAQQPVSDAAASQGMEDTGETETPTEQGTEPGEEQADQTLPEFPGQQLKHSGKIAAYEKIASDYVVPISDIGLMKWSTTEKPDAFKKYVEQMACGLYPTFAPQIQMGLPTRVLLDPYVEVAQQVLGFSMSKPNWSDPKWNAALQGGTDPKTGRPIPMTLDEWTKFLMQHPGHGWETTPEANSRAQQLIQAMQQGFSTSPAGGNQ